MPRGGLMLMMFDLIYLYIVIDGKGLWVELDWRGNV
jgi:hypothetical protein